MFSLFFVLCFASSTVLTAVVIEEPQDLCSELEFRCNDGNCVSLSSFCDGRRDCDDGSDEATCFSGYGSSFLSREKRQSRKKCRKTQWQCRDGSCISFDGKCDGIKDCPDGSDETHPLCRNSRCQSNWFRCTYGACVDGTAPCNGIQDCADNSDELLPACRNESSEARGQFKCENGEYISASLHCDGAADCADASDESVWACAGKTCPTYLFQCAYGACVDAGSDCNGVKECYDGSDESDELCNRTSTIKPTLAPPTPTKKPIQGGACVLPAFPAHGTYVVSGVPNPKPGQAFDTVALNVTCQPGYDMLDRKDIICFSGIWSGQVTDCVRFCRLNKDPSVEYRCLLSGAAEGSRECNLYEPDGMLVRPECKTPNYYFSGVLNYMRCIDGSWDYVARCLPGLTKNGTNITILIREQDQYEVHIGSFQYTVPSSHSNTPDKVNPIADSFTTVNPAFQQVTPVTPNDVDYDIDEDYWRMLKPNSIGGNPNSNLPIGGGNTQDDLGNVKPNPISRIPILNLPIGKGNINFGSNGNPGVRLNIQNSSVVVMAKDNVELDYNKDRIVFRD